MFGNLGQLFGREGEEGDEAEKTNLDAFFASHLHSLHGNTAAGTVSYKDIVGVFAVEHLVADFFLFHLSVLGLQFVVEHFLA